MYPKEVDHQIVAGIDMGSTTTTAVLMEYGMGGAGQTRTRVQAFLETLERED